MAQRVAIVGAGAAGAATAAALSSAAEVTVFEREPTVGGRSDTRERENCRYEVGANYLTTTDDRVASLLEESIPEEQLLGVDGEVRPFDGQGTVGESDDDGTESRLTTTEGLAAVPRYLLEAAAADLVLETPIDAMERTHGQWRLDDAAGRDCGHFDAVVLTPPAPLSADLLGRSEWPHPDCRSVRETIESVPYRPIASVALHYPTALDREWYALVNEDRAHPIGWVAREGAKPGYVPDDESVLLVQCSSEFTVERYGEEPAEVAATVARLTADLLDAEHLADPDWWDYQSWRYAVPEAGVDREPLACTRDHDLYVAGDWVVGEDRLNGALRSGLETAATVREDLD